MAIENATHVCGNHLCSVEHCHKIYSGSQLKVCSMQRNATVVLRMHFERLVYNITDVIILICIPSPQICNSLKKRSFQIILCGFRYNRPSVWLQRSITPQKRDQLTLDLACGNISFKHFCAKPINQPDSPTDIAKSTHPFPSTQNKLSQRRCWIDIFSRN